MRRSLDRFYAATGIVAGTAVAMIMVVVFVQVGGRLLGWGVRGADEIVAWLTASACMSGAGYAFARGAHVRVDLLINRLDGLWRKLVVVGATAASLVIGVYAAYSCVLMVYDSWMLNELSQGVLPVRLWIPQLGLAIGTVALAVALADALVVAVLGLIGRRAVSAEATIREVSCG